jgi:uncharacterized membrane protein
MLENLFFSLAHAATGDTPTVGIEQLESYSPVDLINKAVAYGLILVALLSVVFIFIGGVSFILSGGDEGKVKSAIASIRYAIIGLIVTILSFTIVSLIGKPFGFDLIKYISLEEILKTVNSITGQASQK